MFRIITNQVIEQCEQLAQCGILLTAECIETEEIRRQLGTLSGMEDILDRLKTSQYRLQEETQMLRQLTQGLDKTLQKYRNCENQICENVEQGVVCYERREIDMNDFSKLSKLLEENCLV